MGALAGVYFGIAWIAALVLLLAVGYAVLSGPRHH